MFDCIVRVELTTLVGKSSWDSIIFSFFVVPEYSHGDCHFLRLTALDAVTSNIVTHLRTDVHAVLPFYEISSGLASAFVMHIIYRLTKPDNASLWADMTTSASSRCKHSFTRLFLPEYLHGLWILRLDGTFHVSSKLNEIHCARSVVQRKQQSSTVVDPTWYILWASLFAELPLVHVLECPTLSIKHFWCLC